MTARRSALGQVEAVLLDVNGTLFPTAAASSAFTDLGIDQALIPVGLAARGSCPPSPRSPPCFQLTSLPAPPRSAPLLFPLQLWFASVLRDAACAQLSGVFAPFQDFAGHHLACLAAAASPPRAVAPEAAAAAVAAAWSAAEPFPDLAPALSKLQLGGITVAALTNGSLGIARSVLERAGAANGVALFDINEPKAWKPDRNAYRFATNALLARPEEVLLVAAHPWDCHGALQAGLQACYVQRDPHGAYPAFLDQPQLSVHSLEEAADALLC